MTQFQAFVSTQVKSQVKTVRSHNRGEFVNTNLSSLFHFDGIVNQTTCPHSPDSEQNGTVERKHIRLIETTITLLRQAYPPLEFWSEAFLTSVYLANTTLNFQVRYTLLNNTSPNCIILKTFRCDCFPWLKLYFLTNFIPNPFHVTWTMCLYSSSYSSFLNYSN